MIRLAAALALAWPLAAAAQVPPPQPDGFRTEDYRAPVPAALSGAIVIDNDAAFALWSSGRAAFVDVLPRAPKPENLPEGTIWRDQPHHSIPGALWLPNVGYGELAEETHRYFRAGLAEATGGDRSAPVVFFCLRDCWMSWNAAKRALDYGYGTVFWYPDGTDGWTFFDYPVERTEPSSY